MVGAAGTIDGPRCEVHKGNARPVVPDSDTVAAAMLLQLKACGFSPAQIYKVLDRLPKSERATYRRCGTLTREMFVPDAGDDS